MGKVVLIEEFQLGFYMPKDSAGSGVVEARQALNSRQFRARLRRALRVVLGRFRTLHAVRVRITR